MLKDIHFHLTHYFFLLSILSLGIISYFFLSPYPEKQYAAVIITAILYIIWGIAHHLLEGDLHIKIVVEYILIALLSIMLLRGVIFR
ncbi:hypothetical protein HY407_04655 [Candidatus Gottesmanbacteria bacterium]|nr:hypothetical protein [Candidatus Gottesmanbacteria bacterium]